MPTLVEDPRTDRGPEGREPEREQGPINYFPDLTAHGDRRAIDGESMSYVGPMQKQPANGGTNPPAVDVGEGTISATCG